MAPNLAFTQFLPLAGVSRNLSLQRRSPLFIFACRQQGPTSLQSASSYGYKISRRSAIAALALTITGIDCSRELLAEEYDAMTTRRYVPNGRPAATAAPPAFKNSERRFQLSDSLEAQDVEVGSGEQVQKGSLVRAYWTISLPDGTIVDEIKKSAPVLFRAGLSQVEPGIDQSVIGMKVGGSRLVRGPSTEIFRYGYLQLSQALLGE